MIRFSHDVIFVSLSDYKRMLERYPRFGKKFHFVPNGASIPDVAQSDTNVLDELRLQQTPFILAVGRLVPEKAFHDLIEAYKNSAIDAKLLIVGAADHEDPYSQRLVAQGSKNIIFAGRRSRIELATLYRHAALFVLPSKHEGLPISALEAISASCPVLLSDIPANRGIGLPDKHYFPPGDVAKLGNALSLYQTNRFVVPLEFSLDEFDWDTIAEKTLSIVLTNWSQ